jgi:hypothetical protein
LHELIRRLNHVIPKVVKAEPTTIDIAVDVDMAAFEAAMAKCSTQAECLNLLNLTFTPDAVYSDDQHQEAKTLCETRRAVIKKG